MFPLMSNRNHMRGQNGEILWAWDVASATNSDVPRFFHVFLMFFFFKLEK